MPNTPAARTPPEPSDLTVLIADDSRLQRRILATLLRRWGYRVMEAASGAEALDTCATQAVDIVVSDWMMPGMTGLELCRAFRALPRAEYGYFLLLTSKNETREVARGLEIGADDFLPKPVAAAELRARLSAGKRILGMERELTAKNRLLTDTLENMRQLNAALDRDLEEARRLQHALVGARVRRVGPAEVSLLLRPSGPLGGDLVGVIPGGPDEVGIFAVDVSGHGIASALIAARLASHLTAPMPGQNLALTAGPGRSLRLRPPAEVATRLNRLLMAETTTDHYVSHALARLDLRSGTVSIAQAGYPYPAIRRGDGRVEFLGDGGVPAGLFEAPVYEEIRTTLAPGERLVLASDGITECAGPDGPLGELGLARLIMARAARPADRFLDDMVDDLVAARGGRDFADDISAVMVAYDP